MENKLGKFEKYFEKEDLDKIIEGVDKIFQNKKASNEDYQLAFDVLDKYIEMIKEKGWILSKDVIWTLRKAFLGDLPWHVRQKLILKLGDIVEKFPNELINQIELVDIIINIMKERIEEDPDPDNKFNSVREIRALPKEGTVLN